MTHYRATFSDGSTKEIANSKREYGFGWKAWGTTENGRELVWAGFARTRELAEKSGTSEANFHLKAKIRREGRIVRKNGVLHRVEVVPVEIVPEGKKEGQGR